MAKTGFPRLEGVSLPPPERRESGIASLKPSSPDSTRAPARGKYDRSMSREARHAEQRARLLDASRQIFGAHGWSVSTVEAIVSHAGMSRRTFYEHFTDLEDCLLGVHRQAADRAIAAAGQVLARVMPPFVDSLALVVTQAIESVLAFPLEARILFGVIREAGPICARAHDEVIESVVSTFMSFAVSAHEKDASFPRPEEIRMYALVSALEAVALRYLLRDDGPERAEETGRVLTDILVRTLGLCPSRATT